MARPRPALSLWLPSPGRRPAGERSASAPGGAGGPRLRLVVTRGRLGLELEAGYQLGPVRVEELALGLPHVSFPVDLSGGVDAFRHCRGQLDRLRLELCDAELGRWAAARLCGLLGEAAPDWFCAPAEDGWLVGLRSGRRALAFEVLLAPLAGELRLVCERARGTGLGAPPHALAVAALGALTRPLGRLVGGAVVIEQAAACVSKELLPLCGARAGDATGLVWQAPSFDLGRAALSAERGANPAEHSARLVSAMELATLAAEADGALLAGDLDDARRLYLGLLERAPRHPELVRRAAEIDRLAGGRAEAALGTLSEATPASEAGLLGAELLEAVGDEDGARHALERTSEAEPYGPLAALALCELARLAQEPASALRSLDEAVARAPLLEAAHWSRFELRLRLGDLRGARQDVGHLEAASRGALARHEILSRAARYLLEQGLSQAASELFERSLRYAPDSADAVAGLARAFEHCGRRPRALDLLARAAALAERAGADRSRIDLDLARALAEIADDRPAAIARARGVPPRSPESFEARLLEARWSAELGDLAAAGVALGRLGDAVETSIELVTGPGRPPPDGRPVLWGNGARFARREDACAALAALCVQGAQLEEQERRDPFAARRLLGLALRLRPHERRIEQAFRRLAALAAPALPAGRPPTPVADATAAPEPVVGDEEQVDRLTAKLRADPSDQETVRALATLLERLGRDHDLLALLSARLEEAPAEIAGELNQSRRAVLARLAAAARAAGRNGEAELYEAMGEQRGE